MFKLTVLFFGLNVVLRDFTKLIKVVVWNLVALNVHMLTYLDD